MDNYRDMLGKAAKLFDEAKAILSDEDATGEDKQKVEGFLEEAKALKAKAMRLKEIEAAAFEMKDELEAEELENKDKEIEPRKEPTEFKDWEQFLVAAWKAQHKDPSLRKIDPRLQRIREEKIPGMDSKVMQEATGAGGGFLVPSEFLATLQGVIAENSIVRQRASIIRMNRRQIALPVLDQTGTTAGVPHWFGGMSFYWGEEASAKTVTDAEFREVQLVAHKLYGYTRASDELVEDSAISLADFLSGPLGFAGGVAWMEDYAFLQGSGAGQPLGVINAGATLTVNRTATVPAIQYTDIVNMIEGFLPSGKGVWLVTQAGMSNLLSMMDQAGGAANQGTYIWGSAADGVPSRLLGLPLIFTEKLPAPGTAGDVMLADFRYYLLGDRKATSIESTQYDYWRYDQTSWRVVHRVDGQPWLSAPLTLQDGATQVSPFVILGAKST